MSGSWRRKQKGGNDEKARGIDLGRPGEKGKENTRPISEIIAKLRKTKNHVEVEREAELVLVEAS